MLARRAVDTGLLELQLADALSSAELPGARVRVAVVAELRRDPRTGRLRRFVPLG